MRILGVNLSPMEESTRAQLEAVGKAAGFEVRFYDEKTFSGSAAADCEVFFGRIPVPELKACTSLKWFQCSFAGVDNYCDEGIYPNPEVILTNSAGAYGITISEHMICTLLMMMRGMPKYVEMQKHHGWDRSGEMRSIYGSTVAILGMGDIGANMARRIKAMGAVEVRGIRRSSGKPADSSFDKVYLQSQLDEALAGADVLAVCLPATQETEGIMDLRRFRLLAPGAYVLNVGRGSAINQTDIKQALDEGHLGGAALDVTVPEPLPQDDPLWDAKNLLITPHVSGNMSLTHTRSLILQMFIDNFNRYVSGQPLMHVVDRKAGY